MNLDEYLSPGLKESLKTLQRVEEMYGTKNLADMLQTVKNMPKDVEFPPYLNTAVAQMNALTPVIQAASTYSNSAIFNLEKSTKAFLAFDRTVCEISNKSIRLNNILNLYKPYLKINEDLRPYFNTYPEFQKPILNILEILKENTIEKNVLQFQDALEFENIIQENTDTIQIDEEPSDNIKSLLFKMYLDTKNQKYVSAVSLIFVYATIQFIGNEILEIIDIPPEFVALIGGILKHLDKQNHFNK